MEVRDAVLAVLREEAEPLHWTKIQDIALRREYIDPFSTPDVRKRVLAALQELAHEGSVTRVGTGQWAAAPG